MRFAPFCAATLTCCVMQHAALAEGAVAPVYAQPPIAYVTSGMRCNALGPVVPGGDTIDGMLVQLPPGPVRFDLEGRSAPAEIGIGFGFHIRSSGAQTQEFTASVTHPPMGATGRTQQSWPMHGSGDGSLSYVLEDDFELLSGTWTFRVHDGPVLLFEGAFELIPAGSHKEARRRCPDRAIGS